MKKLFIILATFVAINANAQLVQVDTMKCDTNRIGPISAIRFHTSDYGNVSLIVYDIQGNEVLTLVNEYLMPGTYEAKLEATALPSGVYFYKLTTNTISETKKMMLIK
ncbi:MAG: T9SS type A sorting domain-containing protein [Ignavibacteriae bacterium]|nr:T9SS type A sorting domain-containing protein [Ignavibacteriota bacterium]